jgi:hypothetical protein
VFLASVPKVAITALSGTASDHSDIGFPSSLRSTATIASNELTLARTAKSSGSHDIIVERTAAFDLPELYVLGE